MLDFCLEPKKWEIQFFFLIGLRSDTAPGAVFESRPLKSWNTHKIGITSARYAMLVPFLLFFRKEDNGDLEYSIWVTFKFLNFSYSLSFRQAH